MYEIKTKKGFTYELNLDSIRIYTNPKGEKIVHSNEQVVHLDDFKNKDKKEVLKACR